VPDDQRPARLELRGTPAGLLDEPLGLSVRGAGSGETLLWRARLQDDDGRVWRTAGRRVDGLEARWRPANEGTGTIAALGSLRRVRIDARVETEDGRAATRTLTRHLVDEGVKVRRWRDGLAATLHLPAEAEPCATLIVDATAGPGPVAVATLAAPLLASRGALVLTVGPSRGDDPIAVAAERLAAVPGAAAEPLVLAALEPFAAAGADGVPLPPGVPAREPADATAWDALLMRLLARPRASARPAHD
jgi:hypothetical protein